MQPRQLLDGGFFTCQGSWRGVGLGALLEVNLWQEVNYDSPNMRAQPVMASAFRYASYRAQLQALEPLRLPARKGSALRGAFGHVFRRLACVGGRLCPPCQLPTRCPYHYIFETAPMPDARALRKLTDIPRPFVLEPPEDGAQVYEPGVRLDLGLVLIGRGIDFLPHFIVTLRELGEQGLGYRRGRLGGLEVEAVDGAGPPVAVYSDRDHLVRTHDCVVTLEAIHARCRGMHPRRLTLRFRTPTTLRREGRLVDRPEMGVVIRNLIHRITALSYFHCGAKWPTDEEIPALIRAAESVRLVHGAVHWVDWERYSSRQQTTMKFGGIVGEATYEGDLAALLPLLLVGEAVHVGRHGVFGNGKYEVVGIG